MSRLYQNKSGRSSVFSSARSSPRRPNPDDTYQESPQKKRRGGAKQSVTTPAKTKRRKTVAITSEDDSTTSGDEADGEDDEEDDTPAVPAPSHTAKQRAAGRYKIDRSHPDVSDDDSMFGDQDITDEDFEKLRNEGAFNDPENGLFEDQLFAREDDEDLYAAVEEISDSDPDNASQAAEREFEEDMLQLNAITDDPSSYVNQIDGFSDYGFGPGDESEESLHFLGTSQSSDEGNEALERHVRFEETLPDKRSAFMRLSESPTMTRALLPSALPNSALSGRATSESEATDSDLTDDCLPDIALRTPRNSQSSRKETVSSASETEKKTPKLKGPPSGTFIDDGEKSAGTLDVSGKMLIITNPQHLGEQFAKRYGVSAPPSPSMGFAEAVLDDSESQASQTVVPDPMLSSLNTVANAASNGQAEGPPYAFYAPADDNDDYELAVVMQQDEPEDSDFNELDPMEARINIDDIIDFGLDSEDEEPTSPIYISCQADQAERAAKGKKHTMSNMHTPRNNGVSHLNSGNIMSFRRGNDPAFAALNSSPMAPLFNQMSSPSKKRKARTNSPYNHAHYAGVTPVQRMTRSQQGALNDTPSSSSKRRRIMT